MAQKKCSQCLKDLPEDDFQKDAQKGDGLRSWCRACRRKRNRSYVERWKRERSGAPIPTQKQCGICKITKPIADFAKDACRPDGFHVYCSPCRAPLQKTARVNYRAKHPAKILAKARKDLLKSHGLTEDQFQELFRSQNGVCAICGAESKRGWRTLHIDHCHASGRVRALLCGNCNNALGALRDSPELLRKAADYLEKHR